MNLRWVCACGSWLCKMKEILSIFIPLPLFFQVVRTLVAACYANISSSNLKLSVNCCDDRSTAVWWLCSVWLLCSGGKAAANQGAFTPYVRVVRYKA